MCFGHVSFLQLRVLLNGCRTPYMVHFCISWLLKVTEEAHKVRPSVRACVRPLVRLMERVSNFFSWCPAWFNGSQSTCALHDAAPSPKRTSDPSIAADIVQRPFLTRLEMEVLASRNSIIMCATSGGRQHEERFTTLVLIF